MAPEKDHVASLRDAERVLAVRRTGLLDAPPEPALDRLTRIVCRSLRCSGALVCLVTEDRQFFVGQHGLPEPAATDRQTPLDYSVCQHVVSQRSPLIVPDAREHDLLRNNLAVTELGMVAYAGVPLFGPDGQALGTLAAIDDQPRRWTETDVAALQDLAALATLELHRRLSRASQAADPFPLDSDSLPAMAWTLRADGGCDYVNARWLEFTGRLPASELEDGWTDRLHAEDRVATLGQIRTAIAQRIPFQSEFRMQRHDGQYRWLLNAGVPRFDRDGTFLGLAGVATDVTDRRQLEQRLVRAERAQAIGQLAGGIAHDFNNLLTGIIGHAALLQEEPGLSTLAKEDLAQIQRSADRAASLTRQLLAFSRRQVLAPRVLDLNQLVAGSLSNLRRLVGPRIQVVWLPASHLDAIVADPNQIEHVITQLSTNARESMPDGGTLEISTRQEPLDGPRLTRLSVQRPGTYVILQVRDSGRGMDAATLERIFEPFFSTKKPSEGAGLGLASVYGIVKQSGGHIEAASEPGLGTTFMVYFPRHEGSGPLGDGASGRDAVGGDETILLVEDEEQVRELARRVLERVGYTVLAAHDPESAIALADRHAGHIHLLVADMMLPRSGGREVAARLSIHRPAIKVLYISGTSDGSIARLRLIEPGTAFLEKPFSPDRLLRTVRQALGDPSGGGRPA
ncbi:MAG: ATP-binding protein [Gemmatimonadales bacterium]